MRQLNGQGSIPIPPPPPPSDSSANCLDLLATRITPLQPAVLHIQDQLAKYDFSNYAKLVEFLEDLPQDKQQPFQTLEEEGCLTAKGSLQAAVHAADTSSRSLATGIVVR